ncbi:nuclear transport factor 2 family protein [Amycolatopsis rhabdoformis]|uniref:Nuclear transport factor 2 family protein n=1 Tax=Amycolatopsis rhabdoformis TaxID=1448059 RepID=A0ABZ1IGA1_9PSEU|nr:nuclear transport factor 2 family protein [Amycolatopsis rhabdoformis]WSE32703.1 nuclear transport factor 2 family protein [Amycolatopsis rhabdoformis]
MPWFPDFVNAAELARKQTRVEGHADPVGQFFAALTEGDAQPLEAVWPGEVVVYDPRAGEVRGRKELRRFVQVNQTWLGEQHARAETIATTRAGGRAVVELLARLGDDGQVAWPVAVVAESADERSVVFRTYCSQWPVDGKRHLRPAILASADTPLGDVVGHYLEALDAGDAGALVATFSPGGYLREPIGAHARHTGPDELREFFTRTLAAGGVHLEPCVVTDDGVRCVLEYTCVHWGSHDVPPQAGVCVFDRGPDGLLSAVRVYDDIEAPAA